MLQGYYYENDAAKTLAVTTPHASNPRIDRVILELNWAANTITAKMLGGTAAVTPAAPTLTLTFGTLWQYSLGQVRVEPLPNATITAAQVTPERTFPRLDTTGSPGDIKFSVAAVPPAGWLLAYGQAVSRITYRRLYDALGGAASPHGQGDGSTTFGIPNFRGCVAVGLDNMGGTPLGLLPGATQMGGGLGAAAHTLTAGEMPAHQHGVVAIDVSVGGPSVTHTHGIGAYAAASEAAHTHGPGTLTGSSGDQSQSHQHYLATGIGNGFGTAGVTIATEAAHAHAATGLTFAGSALGTHVHSTDSQGGHTHTVTESGAATASSFPAGSGGGNAQLAGTQVLTSTTAGAHTHAATATGAGTPAGTVGGTSAAGTAHGHTGTVTGFTDTTNAGHGHTTTMGSGTSAAGTAHGHTLSGASAASADSHAHAVTLSGGTDYNGGGTAHNNVQPSRATNVVIKW